MCPLRERPSSKQKTNRNSAPTAEILHFSLRFLRSFFSRVCVIKARALGGVVPVLTHLASPACSKSQFSLSLHCIKIQISFRRAHDVIKATPFSTFICAHPYNVIFFRVIKRCRLSIVSQQVRCAFVCRGCNFARKAALKEEKIWLCVAFRAVTSFLSLAPFSLQLLAT